ncbi:hypothetical protein NXS19_003359 [Fusarium pseudograminearum]|nr:hypothetical protein NXS19_003359 [Fusarium pseudograminearum]
MVIGEIGISYDINKAHAYRTGCYDKQRDLMNGLISAMENNKLNYTLWNYNPANRVEYGDGWNKEDFSVINGDDVVENGPIKPDYRNYMHEKDELYKGGRILDVIIRPYAVKTAGIPQTSNWNHKTLRFEYTWTSVATKESTDEKAHLTEIFIPSYHYDNPTRYASRAPTWSGHMTSPVRRCTCVAPHMASTASLFPLRTRHSVPLTELLGEDSCILPVSR